MVNIALVLFPVPPFCVRALRLYDGQFVVKGRLGPLMSIVL